MLPCPAALSQGASDLGNVAEIVFVGGRREDLEFRATPEQIKPFRDLNFELDPAATARVLALGVPLTLAGWEVSAKMWLTPDDLDRLEVSSDQGVRWLAQVARPHVEGPETTYLKSVDNDALRDDLIGRLLS